MSDIPPVVTLDTRPERLTALACAVAYNGLRMVARQSTLASSRDNVLADAVAFFDWLCGDREQ